jgi:UDP-N-acetylmuramate dehydrogenase
MQDEGMVNLSTQGPATFDPLSIKDRFGEKFNTSVSLARFTSARIGGPAEGFLMAESIDDLVEMASFLWEMKTPFIVLGGGSNVLVSDSGVRGIVLLNKARRVEFDMKSDPPAVWAASGTNFGVVARQAAEMGLAGLEWAAGIPGTIGGAVFGNAGAHGGDMAGNLIVAEILHREWVDSRSKNGNLPRMLIQRQEWTQERFEFAYRSSLLKKESRLEGFPQQGQKVQPGIEQPEDLILAALLRLERSTKEAVETRLDELVAYRRKTQPPGASMGSMFKNPPDDNAGRLIDEAGLKGTRVGNAAISSLHGNFFINYGDATANEVWELIKLARGVVANKFGINLELEIQLLGSWEIPNQ